MRYLAYVALTCSLALFVRAEAADRKDEGCFLARPLKGDYYVYGGSLGDRAPPTAKDRKLSLMFTGILAKDLLNQIGPDPVFMQQPAKASTE
ncbi:hypothetical protein [Pseudoduganella sp. OTU4001]|uniref:hypothetical protein n=1 Tax=Pseudoduganella sp. OTU4001 TaxID=3043854 RepID=UPI00313E6D0E